MRQARVGIDRGIGSATGPDRSAGQPARRASCQRLVGPAHRRESFGTARTVHLELHVEAVCRVLERALRQARAERRRSARWSGAGQTAACRGTGRAAGRRGERVGEVRESIGALERRPEAPGRARLGNAPPPERWTSNGATALASASAASGAAGRGPPASGPGTGARCSPSTRTQRIRAVPSPTSRWTLSMSWPTRSRPPPAREPRRTAAARRADRPAPPTGLRGRAATGARMALRPPGWIIAPWPARAPRSRGRGGGSPGRSASRRPAVDLDRLVLQQLVRLEEVRSRPAGAAGPAPVARHGPGGGRPRPRTGPCSRRPSRHASPGPRSGGPDPDARECRLVDQEQRVGMVAVIGPGALDEAVLEVVVDGRREHAIEPEHAGLLVELVLVPAAAGISTTISTRSETRRTCPNDTAGAQTTFGASVPASSRSIMSCSAHHRIASASVSRIGRNSRPKSARVRLVSTSAELSSSQSIRSLAGSGLRRPPGRSPSRTAASWPRRGTGGPACAR